MAYFDANGDGEISEKEFLAELAGDIDNWDPPLKAAEKEEILSQFRAHFAAMDPDGSGSVTREELHNDIA